MTPTRARRKPTKTQLRNRADRIFSAWVREHGSCEAKGVGGFACSERMQCAHIISRRYLGVRWDPLNAMCLCSAHHSYFTREDLRWELWRDSYLGSGVYEAIREKALSNGGPPNYARVLSDLEAFTAAVRA